MKTHRNNGDRSSQIYLPTVIGIEPANYSNSPLPYVVGERLFPATSTRTADDVANQTAPIPHKSSLDG
jgi:hypothetical protein